jgi:hypothetical protein
VLALLKEGAPVLEGAVSKVAAAKVGVEQ